MTVVAGFVLSILILIDVISVRDREALHKELESIRKEFTEDTRPRDVLGEVKALRRDLALPPAPQPEPSGDSGEQE